MRVGYINNLIHTKKREEPSAIEKVSSNLDRLVRKTTKPFLPPFPSLLLYNKIT